MSNEMQTEIQDDADFIANEPKAKPDDKPEVKSDAASEKQVSFCESLSFKKGIPLPNGYKESWKIAKKFIEEASSKPDCAEYSQPTESQKKAVSAICNKRGIKSVPKFDTKREYSDWIKKANEESTSAAAE